MKNKDLIIEYLKEKIIDPKIELDYNADYELLLAVMLSAQTTDVRVNSVTNILFTKYPSIEALVNADISDIEQIIKPIGAYRVKASHIKNIALRLSTGYDLSNREFLESLPGVGRKTANVVLANLFSENVIAVDTHVKRVSVRLGIATSNDSVLEIEKKLTRIFKDDLHILHHRMVLFGRYYCKAQKPICNGCKLYDICKEKKRFN